MIDVIEYPCGEAPLSGQVREVAPGVLWLRMPMPFALNHINLWAISDNAPTIASRGWAVVDTGLQTSETEAAWRHLFSDKGPLDGHHITRVFVTHMHPDHIGRAGWISRAYDCNLWMTSGEYLNCRLLQGSTGREALLEGVAFYRKAGWSVDNIEDYRTGFGGLAKFIHPLPESYIRIQDGEVLRIGEHDWRVVVGKGHSPEHACFYCPALKLLISGDQVLPKISSNVSVYPTKPDADPLGQWLESIAKIKREVPDDVLVLPAHNEPFRGLHARLDNLLAGHLKSLARLRERLADPRRVIDVFGALFARSVTGDFQLLRLATGESTAHINYLMKRGEAIVVRMENEVAWYQCSLPQTNASLQESSRDVDR